MVPSDQGTPEAFARHFLRGKARGFGQIRCAIGSKSAEKKRKPVNLTRTSRPFTISQRGGPDQEICRLNSELYRGGPLVGRTSGVAKTSFRVQGFGNDSRSGRLLGVTPTSRVALTQDSAPNPLHPAPKNPDPLHSPESFQPTTGDIPNECSEAQWKSDADQIRPSAPASSRSKRMSGRPSDSSRTDARRRSES